MNISLKHVLVTGGSGMVGAELRKLIPEAQYPSSKELDLMSQTSIKNYFRRHDVQYVVHLAAYVGSLHDNIQNKIRYFDLNIIMNTLITKYAYESNVEHFLGVLSTCIYPDSIDSYPITEDRLHAGAPHADLMSYAYAKRAHAVQLDAYKSSHDLDYNYLVPSNLYGPAPCGHQERAHFVNDLILKVLTAKKCGNTSIELFGDGTPLRQFMLASDFALFIKNYIDNQVNESLNVAPDYNFSVDEMAKMVLEIAAVPEMEIVYNSSKPNGQHRKDVSSDKLKMLFPDFQFTSFREGLKHTLGHYEKIV